MKNSKNNIPVKIWMYLGVIGFLMTGCGYKIPKYDASVDNVKKMRSIKVPINIGEFTSKEKGLNSITCRGSFLSIDTPDDAPFERYIKNALISELKHARKFNSESGVTISGYLEEVDFNSTIGIANWTFKIKLSSSNSKSIVVHTKHEFSSSFIASNACTDVVQAFVPAVQKLINEIVGNRDFKKLL